MRFKGERLEANSRCGKGEVERLPFRHILTTLQLLFLRLTSLRPSLILSTYRAQPTSLSRLSPLSRPSELDSVRMAAPYNPDSTTPVPTGADTDQQILDSATGLHGDEMHDDEEELDHDDQEQDYGTSLRAFAGHWREWERYRAGAAVALQRYIPTTQQQDPRARLRLAPASGACSPSRWAALQSAEPRVHRLTAFRSPSTSALSTPNVR